MAHCCVSRAARCTPASPKHWRASSPRSPRTSRSCWRVTAPRPGRSRRPQVCGVRRDSGRWSARHWLSRPAVNARPWPDCDPPRHSCAASRRNQAASRTHKSTHARERTGGTRNHKGCGTSASVDRKGRSPGEAPEDPLLLFSVLYGFWVGSYVAGNGNIVCDLASKFLALAEKQTATAPLMIGHRMVGTSMLFTGHLTQGRATSIRRLRFIIQPRIAR